MVEETIGATLATVVARAGQEDALRQLVAERFAVVLPEGSKRVAGTDIAFLGTGPRKWLVRCEGMETLAPLAQCAAVVDQSGADGILTLSGSHAERLLARAVAIDLDLQHFPTGSVATTLIEHMGLTIARIDDNAFELYVIRSLGLSFAHWLSGAIDLIHR